jgi:inner membrane protein
LASVIAAELPDLDNFWPEPDAVLHALRAHRGLSHAWVVSPLWALVATAVGCLVFRRARFGPVFLFSLLAVVFGHLAGDLWTGWGTRLLLPFSDQRLSLDWVAVIDPYLTLPLLIGAIWAWRRRDRWRQALVVGLAISSAYLGFRVASRAVLMGRVEGAYAAAREVEVFPTLLSMSGWRWVAVLPDGYVAGRVSLLGPLVEEGRHGLSQALPAVAANNPTVEEALAWARIPVTSVEPLAGGRLEVRVADLRYHMGGEPTLEFVVVVGPEGETEDARLERGGSARDLYERWRAPGAPSAAGAR